jgi:hypothetical protein
LPENRVMVWLAAVIRAAVRELVKRTPLRHVWHSYVAQRKPRSQTNEGALLKQLVGRVAIPKLFVEFGFHPVEFNCAELIGSFEGLLIDGNRDMVAIARKAFPPNQTAVCEFLDLDHLGTIIDFCRGRELGILSIDVDGNDYWFLDRLISLRPALIIVEYNASFGRRPLSVPYDKSFTRHAKHPSGWYHGASLAAETWRCERAGYSLVAVTVSGANAFFLRDDLMGAERKLAAEDEYRENVLRNGWSGSNAAQQWEQIRHLPLLDVTSLTT